MHFQSRVQQCSYRWDYRFSPCYIKKGEEGAVKATSRLLHLVGILRPYTLRRRRRGRRRRSRENGERSSSRSREQISLMDIDPKLSRPLLRVATITRVLTLPGLVPAKGPKIGGQVQCEEKYFTEFYFCQKVTRLMFEVISIRSCLELTQTLMSQYL